MKLAEIADRIPPEVTAAIPRQYLPAWERALKQRKRKPGGVGLNATVKAVVAGRWTVLYGDRVDVIEKAARDNGLEFMRQNPTDPGSESVAFLPQNRDFGELMMTSLQLGHYVRGVVLGYPIEAIDSWVRKWRQSPAAGANP